MKNYETPAYATWFILLILWILLLVFFPPDAFPAIIHTVQKGDTLSGIAQKELGDWRRWKDLAAWNDLKVQWRKGIPYVLIKPGQRIILKSAWTEEKIERYRLDTKHLLRREIFRMVGTDKIPVIDVKAKISLTIDLSCQYDIRVAQKELKSTLIHLANLERILIAQEIFDYSARMQLSFFRDKAWINERKTAVLLMSLMTTESHGRFLKGKHGELGIYQQKPETFRVAMGYEKEDLPEIEEALMTSHHAGMKCAVRLLMRGNSPYDALRRYNAGKNGKDRVYALRVMRVYYGMLERGK